MLDGGGATFSAPTSTYKIGAPGAISLQQFARGAGDRACWRRRSRAAALALPNFSRADRPWRTVNSSCPAARRCHRRKLQRQSGLGCRGAGAARPGASRAARAAYRGAWRHAGTWTAGPSLHRAGSPGDRRRGRSRVLLWALMQNLWKALPAGRRGGYAGNSTALEAQVVSAIRPATRSWSRVRSARAWRLSSRPCNARIRTGIRSTEQAQPLEGASAQG